MKPTSQNRNPAVSILVATRNNAPYLREALDTLLGQTFPDFELIVVDDGSTDHTQQILGSYRDPRLVPLRNDQRRGVAAARNRTIAASRARLIAVADADDRYDLRRLERQVVFLQEHPAVDIAVSDFYKMTAGGQVFERVRIPRTDAQIKFNFLWQSPLSHPTALCRRDAVLRSGGYDESFSSAVDTDWFARMSDYGTFGVLPEPLHYYRKYSSSTSENHDPAQEQRRFCISHRLVCKYLGREISDSQGVALRDLLCAYKAVAPGQLDSALALLGNLLHRARERESVVTWHWIRRRVSSSLLAQSKNLSYVAPRLSRQVLCKAISLDWRCAAGRAAWLQTARLLAARIRGKIPGQQARDGVRP